MKTNDETNDDIDDADFFRFLARTDDSSDSKGLLCCATNIFFQISRSNSKQLKEKQEKKRKFVVVDWTDKISNIEKE